MPAEYTNRRKEKHYVKVVPSKTGKARYYVIKDKAKAKPEELLQEVPPGFEFYEIPNEAQVVFRKVPIYHISDAEVEIVDSVMKKHKTVSDYIIDKSADDITIYIPHQDSDVFAGFPDLHERFNLMKTYNDCLKFEKTRGIYDARRFCYLSSYYGWISMECSRDLKYLAEKYCHRIDKESLLDFWIEGEDDY